MSLAARTPRRVGRVRPGPWADGGRGERVLTRERLKQCYNGSLFYTVADRVRAGLKPA